jgi:2'-5' RNA ligase
MKNIFNMMMAKEASQELGWAWVDVEDCALRQRLMSLASSAPPELLAKDGIEEDPHITVVYGLPPGDPESVAEVLHGREYAQATLGPVDVFENPDYDVVHVSVNSGCLDKMHWAIRNKLKIQCNFPDYSPHITLAYLQKGEGRKYRGSKIFDGEELTFTKVNFQMGEADPCSGNIERVHEIPLVSPCRDTEHDLLVKEYRVRFERAIRT